MIFVIDAGCQHGGDAEKNNNRERGFPRRQTDNHHRDNGYRQRKLGLKPPRNIQHHSGQHEQHGGLRALPEFAANLRPDLLYALDFKAFLFKRRLQGIRNFFAFIFAGFTGILGYLRANQH